MAISYMSSLRILGEGGGESLDFAHLSLIKENALSIFLCSCLFVCLSVGCLLSTLTFHITFEM